MTVQQTSRDALKAVDRVRQQAILLNGIAKYKEICIADLASYLFMEKSTVSARLNELKKTGRIELVGKKKSKTTNILAEHWRIQYQTTLF